MPRYIHLEPHLTDDELHDRYRRAGDPVERSHWHFLWLLAGGMTATAVAAVTGYSAYWIGQIARRYNTDGPDGVRDRRHMMCTGRPALPASQLTKLRAALAGPHPEATIGAGARWPPGSVPTSGAGCVGRRAGAPCGGSVPAGARPGRAMCRPTRWPRPRSSPACAHCYGRWPLRSPRRASSSGPSTNIASASNRSSGRCGRSTSAAPSRPSSTATRGATWSASCIPPLVGPSSTWPASGRTIFHLASGVSIPLFEAELAAFAKAVGAGSHKQVVLILDQAGWHTSERLRVPSLPEHVHLLFLPPLYSKV